ncbi:MAG TPA: cohesin domain-containing protein [Povalibacter sp.]|uniref:cohesin domain-containing protein n=1 Tax=Povalibacter sp. TaxID=1962978 RepID=UPI002BF5E93D|nr:cohesin domain-containing protein [Povalibacter sp.]HMN43062.1 cohesin domain-containing protein [Povalibacter sp.]
MKAKTKLTNRILLSCAILAASTGVANAIPMLSVVPASASVTQGGTASVDVMVSGLDGGFVGAYDLNLAWDAPLLSLTNVRFDTFLDGPLNSGADFSSTAGSANIFEFSFSGLSNQLGLSQFRLFSLDFSALDLGLAAISITGGDLWGYDGLLQYESWDVSNGSLLVNAPSTSVPEPASFGLLLAGLAGSLVARRKRKTAEPVNA